MEILKAKAYKLALHKSYFDKGYGITSYVKYLIAFFGLASSNVKTTLTIGIIYAVTCYILGRILYKIGYVEAEAEVGNQYNQFQKEMRKKLKIEKLK